jgi:hypothetical protein
MDLWHKFVRRLRLSLSRVYWPAANQIVIAQRLAVGGAVTFVTYTIRQFPTSQTLFNYRLDLHALKVNN